jgi:hypothetical protein
MSRPTALNRVRRNLESRLFWNRRARYSAGP